MLRVRSAGLHVSRAFATCGRSFVGLGSNIGDRAANIHNALREVAAFADVVDTSFLYESKA